MELKIFDNFTDIVKDDLKQTIKKTANIVYKIYVKYVVMKKLHSNTLDKA